MSSETYERIRSNPKFQELVSRRSRLAWTLSAIVLVGFYGFVMLVAFAPALIGQRVAAGSTLTVGVAAGPHHVRVLLAAHRALRPARQPGVRPAHRRDREGGLGPGARAGGEARRGRRRRASACSLLPALALAAGPAMEGDRRSSRSTSTPSSCSSSSWR